MANASICSTDPDVSWVTSAAQRLPALEGARNFRDLGGYPADDGKHVRWGLLYRSGSLAGLTPASHERLTAMGVRSVCDLRSAGERSSEPFGRCDAVGLSYWSRDYTTSFGELRTLMASSLPTVEAARGAMIAGYQRLPYEQAPAYRELFRRLHGGEVPLVFNCSAGKDRAGTAAALILSALGVPRDIVVEDYTLTDKVVDLQQVLVNRRSTTLSQQPAGVISAILRADPDYIQVALESVTANSGSLQSYLQEELGVGPSELETIRKLLLQ
jgi:protein-tyrosine phosphatase